MAARRGFYPRNQTVLALDIGSRFIKIAELRFARGVISVLGVAACPTPEGVLDNTQILDPVTLGRAIKDLLRISKMQCKTCIVSVSSPSSVVVRPIELPRMTNRELAESMKFEVERHIPFSAEEIQLDYAPLDDINELPEDQPNMKVLLAVAQEELIEAYLKVLRVAGLRPVAMDVEILSAMRAIVDIHAMDGSYEKTYALVNIGASSTEISVVERGNVVFTRSVRIAGDQLTEAIAEQLGRSFEEAEELKKSQGRVFVESEVDELPAPASEHVPDFSGTSTFGMQETSAFTGFGDTGTTPPAAADAGLQLQNVFSLEDDAAPSTGGMFALDESDSPSPFALDDSDDVAASPFTLADDTPPASSPFSLADDATPASSPFMLADDASPFMLDDEADTANDGAMRLGATENDDASGAMFQLMADDDQEAAFTLEPESAPHLGAGPVFDLSSELEEQRPSLPRSTFGQDAEFTAQPSGMDAGIFTPVEDDVPAPAAFSGFGNMESTLFMPEASMPTYERPEGPKEDIFQRRIFDAMLPTLGELVTEIQRSLEYYSSHESTAPIDRIVLYGGTSRLPHLADFVEQEIGVESVNADPLEYLDLSALRQPRDYIKELAPALPICIGLGLRDMLA